MEKDNIYLSLDEARKELQKRWNNVELRKKIEEELETNFIDCFKFEPRGVLWRSLPSPDNGFTFFYQMAKYVNSNPILLEYLGDKFVSINEEKKGLCELSIELENGDRKKIDAVDINSFEGRKLSEMLMKNGEKLVDFHHNLFREADYLVEFKDITDWCHSIGKASDYYYPYLLHFVAHGILFEFFLFEEDERENYFTNNIIFPAIEKIEKKFGLKPMVVRLYPKDQTDDEDFYWWSYPSDLNKHLLNYAKEHDFPLRECK